MRSIFAEEEDADSEDDAENDVLSSHTLIPEPPDRRPSSREATSHDPSVSRFCVPGRRESDRVSRIDN